MNTPLLSLAPLTIPGRLQDVTLSIKKSEIIGFFGPNGSGKSTLISVLCGFQRQYLSLLTYEGQPLGSQHKHYLSQVGVVFQTNSLDERLSPWENFLLARYLYNVKGISQEKRVKEVLEAVAFPMDSLHVKVKTLSGGNRRKLDVARALFPSPSLLFLDEPTVGFDEYGFRTFWEHLMQYAKANGTTIVMATHRPEEADMCGRCLVLHSGRVVMDSTPAQLKSRIKQDALYFQFHGIAPITTEQAQEKMGVLPKVQTGDQGGGSAWVVLCDNAPLHIAQWVQILGAGSIKSLRWQAASMADVFFHLTGDTL